MAHLKVPKNRVDRIIFFAKLSESISGRKESKEELMETINKENLILTSEQKELIDRDF